ncbi:hypothetical protein [Aeromonas phage Asp37]|nr:hypothetical protein [Aeromonas phage Asp37]
MKKMMLCAVIALGLSACAVPVELKQNQADERQALRDYHKAERQAYRAGELKEATTVAKAAATAAKILADRQAEVALQALETEMSK